MRTDRTRNGPDPDPRRIAMASAVRPVHLAVLGAGALGTAGLVLAGHPLLGSMVLALGLLAYGALIGLDMFDPRFIRRVHEQDATTPAASVDVPPAAPVSADQPGARPADAPAADLAAGIDEQPP